MDFAYPPVVVNVLTDASARSFPLLSANQFVESRQYSPIYSESQMPCSNAIWKRYKYFITGSIVTLSYGILYKKIAQLNSCLALHVWSFWKEHLSLPHLINVSKDDLIKDLLSDIKQYYISKGISGKLYNLMHTFINDLDQERQAIENYLFLYKWSKRFGMNRMLPFVYSELNHANQCLERLKFLEVLLRNWECNDAICAANVK